jgi:hypothetical protein
MFCDGLGSNIVIFAWFTSVPFMAELLQGSIWTSRLGNQAHSMIQTLFPKNDAVFQDDNAPIHTAGTVQSWFEEHEGELQHLPLANTITGFQDH